MYLSRSCLKFCVQSSNNFWFISINNLSALYIRPWIVLQEKNKTRISREHKRTEAIKQCSKWVTVSSLTYLFQWDFELIYNEGKTMGNILATLSLTKLIRYSLFQKYRALSATWTLQEKKILNKLWRKVLFTCSLTDLPGSADLTRILQVV